MIMITEICNFSDHFLALSQFYPSTSQILVNMSLTSFCANQCSAFCFHMLRLINCCFVMFIIIKCTLRNQLVSLSSEH